MKLIGIEISKETIDFAVIKTDGTLIKQWHIPTNTRENGIKIMPEVIKELTNEFENGSLARAEVKGIGVACPGQVNLKAGTVIAPSLAWTEPQFVAAEIEAATLIPTKVISSADALALGEKLKSDNQLQNIVTITLGDEILGGMLLNGKLYHGAGFAGQFGQMVVKPNGLDWGEDAPKGSLNAYSSDQAIINSVSALLKEYQEPSVLRLKENELTVKLIMDAANLDDHLACQVMDEVAFYLAVACANLASAFNPEQLIIGGNPVLANALLLPKVQSHFNELVFKDIKKSTKLCLANGAHTGVLGAASINI